MFTFLEKLAQFPPVSEVLLVSRAGEPMYLRIAGNKEPVQEKIDVLTELLRDFEFPRFAEIYFEEGLYFYVDVAFGHIIVGLHTKTGFEKVKKACLSVQTKLDSAAACRNILVKLASDTTLALRPGVIRALQPYADEETAGLLLPMLRQALQETAKGAGELVGAIVQLLGNTASLPAFEELRALLDQSSVAADASAHALQRTIEAAVKQLELDLGAQDVSQKESVALKKKIEVEPRAEAVSPPSIATDSSPEETTLAALIQDGDQKGAVAMAMAQIEFFVKKKKFKDAEAWRDKLILIDSMAIQEIVKSAEMIDEARTAAISSDHIETWRRMAKALSREEFTALYHAMDHVEFAPGGYIVSQGNFKPYLYFVDKGKVQILGRSQGRVMPLKIVESGGIFGAENFFEGSVWTVDAVSLGADVSILSKEGLHALKDSCPSLYSKLHDFCMNFPSVNTLFNRTKRNRRQYPRVNAQGRVAIAFLQEGANELGTGVKGELTDISQGGASFTLHFSKRKYALALVSQVIEMTIRPMNMQNSLTRKGQVMAIHSHGFVGNEFSIHVEFDEVISPTDVTNFSSE